MPNNLNLWRPSNSVSRVLPFPLLLSLTALIVALGCAKQDPTQQVSGKVTYKGTALDHGMLNFFPSGSRPIGAAITPDGSYQVDLPPGEYKVIVNAPPKLPDGFKEGDPLPPPDPNALPLKYSRQQTSGLAASVKMQDEPLVIDFALE